LAQRRYEKVIEVDEFLWPCPPDELVLYLDNRLQEIIPCSESDVDDLVSLLALPEERAARLRLKIMQAMAEYVIRMNEASTYADLPEVLELLRAIARDAARIDAALDRLAPDVLMAVAIVPTSGQREGAGESLGWDHLQQQLRRLSKQASELARITTPRSVGRLGKKRFMADYVGRLVSLVEAFAVGPVTTSQWESGVRKLRFTGVEGGFIKRFFILTDNTVAESSIVRIIRDGEWPAVPGRLPDGWHTDP
jgi:hypothetical protein